MPERHFAGILIEVLKYFNKNHLGQILFTHSPRQMRAHEAGHEGVEVAQQFARGTLVTLGDTS